MADNVNFTNAMPQAIVSGIRDAGSRQLPFISELIPQHLPLFYLFTQRGPEEPVLCSSDYMKTVFGTASFEERSPFFTHQTLAATVCNAVGNQVYIKRVIPEDATAANFVLCIEIVRDEIPQYERDGNEVVRDLNGDKKVTASTVTGYKVRWLMRQVADINNLRGEVKHEGTLTSSLGETSMVYPIFAARMDVGAFGNNFGFTMFQPGPNTAEPADMEIVTNEEAMLYASRWYHRDASNRTPYIYDTVNSERSVEFCLREAVVNTKLSMDLPFSRWVSEYGRDESTGTEMVPGVVNGFHIYQDNINDVVEALWENEELLNPALTNAHQLNIMSALDHDGNDHYSFVIDESSMVMDASTIHFATGGSDGTMGEEALAALVEHECRNNWANIDYPLLDEAKYPLSVVYDTGFPLETKKAILDTIGYRSDISVAVCTQDVLEAPNSISEESSIMTALRAYARLTPESIIHGTPVARAVAMGQVGTWKNCQYKHANNIPVLMAIIEKRARYMGASNGKFKTGFAYDSEGTKKIDTMVKVSHPWKPRATRVADWDRGLNWVQNADRNSLFIPAMQTLYDNDTSPLNSEINMLILVDVIKKSIEVWRRMTGNALLTDEQFAERSDDILLELTEGCYDKRCIIKPKTIYTKMDQLRGYSWTQNVSVYMNNMRTVDVINVSVHRRSDLNN